MIPLNQKRLEPDLCAIMEQLEDRIKTTINCISIGTITSFDPDTQTAEVRLNYKKLNLYDGTIKDYQPLLQCPVIVLGGGEGYISFPISSGDTCIVLFCDREIDTWIANGGVNPPQSNRVHDMNDAIALVGIRNSQNAITDYSENGIKISYGGGTILLDSTGTITVSGSNVVIIGSEAVNINPLI